VNAEEAAKRILGRDVEKQEVFFDPVTITVIAAITTIIFNVIRTYAVCKKLRKTEEQPNPQGAAIKVACQNPTGPMRRMIRRTIRRRLGRDERHRVDELYEAFIRNGAQATEQELQELYDGA
jgi:hypothetical protein